jgi:DNA polymerase III epsilon subunit-like protein
MPVNTVSSDDVVYVNGKPTFVTKISKDNRGGRGGGGGRDGRGGRGGRGGFRAPPPYTCRAEQLTPRLDLVTPGELLAFDCEGMMLAPVDGKIPKGVGRVSVVNEKLELVYDTFVHYGDRPHRPDPQYLNLGVKTADIKPYNGAQLYEDVLEALKALFDKSGGLVAHDFRSDMRMLDDLDFSDYERHDTQNVQAYCALNRNKPPGLSMLASAVLGVYLDRTDGHSSIDDARVTMQLWVYHITGTIPQLATTSGPVSAATATTTSDPVPTASAITKAAPVPAVTATTTSTAATTASTTATATTSSATATATTPATRVQPSRSCKNLSRIPSGMHGWDEVLRDCGVERLAPGHLVALPRIPKLQPAGKVFDPKSSMYVPKMKYVYDLGVYVPIDYDITTLEGYGKPKTDEEKANKAKDSEVDYPEGW